MMDDDDFDDYDDGYEYYHSPIYGWKRIGKPPTYSLQFVYLILDILILVFIFYGFYQSEEWVFWTMLIATIVGLVVGKVVEIKRIKKRRPNKRNLNKRKMMILNL